MLEEWELEMIEVYYTKNISTSSEENDQFRALLGKNVNVFIQVMPNNKPVDISSYLK